MIVIARLWVEAGTPQQETTQHVRPKHNTSGLFIISRIIGFIKPFWWSSRTTALSYIEPHHIMLLSVAQCKRLHIIHLHSATETLESKVRTTPVGVDRLEWTRYCL